MGLSDILAVKALGRELGRSLSDDQAAALASDLEGADLARRLRKAAGAGRNRRLKRLTSIRKRAEKLAAALGLDDDARADLDIMTPSDAPSCDVIASHLRDLAALAEFRASQVRELEVAVEGRPQDEAIEALAKIAERHLGIDVKAFSTAQRSLFTDFVQSVFKCWGARPPKPRRDPRCAWSCRARRSVTTPAEEKRHRFAATAKSRRA